MDISNYIFFTIGIDGAHVELYDEQKTVSILYLCLPILVLIEPEGNTTEKELAQNIGKIFRFFFFYLIFLFLKVISGALKL